MHEGAKTMVQKDKPAGSDASNETLNIMKSIVGKFLKKRIQAAEKRLAAYQSGY